MERPEEKTIATLALLTRASAVIFKSGVKGLGVVTNIVCAIGGMVVGAILFKP